MSKIVEYKCPCCGGAIFFDTDSQKMKCPYCDTEFDVETLAAYDEILNTGSEKEPEWHTPDNGWDESEAEDLLVYVCDSCGGEIIGDKTLAATKCPFCDSPVVMSAHFKGDLKPDLVVPFKIDKEGAKKAYYKHLEGKRLMPKIFKDQDRIDEIKGLYVPFWLCDADADANVRYRATKLRFWSDSQYNYTETKHYAALRAGSIAFEGVPVDGSTKMPDDISESVEPFDLTEAVDFRTAYLSGFFADRYDVSAEESINRANTRVKVSTEESFASTVVGYSSVKTENSVVNIKNGKARYALLPIWILNTTYKGEKYIFAVNGQTGKSVGNLPLDKAAYVRWLLGVGLGVAAPLAAILYFLFN